jgi:hypothetical protein
MFTKDISLIDIFLAQQRLPTLTVMLEPCLVTFTDEPNVLALRQDTDLLCSWLFEKYRSCMIEKVEFILNGQEDSIEAEWILGFSSAYGECLAHARASLSAPYVDFSQDITVIELDSRLKEKGMISLSSLLCNPNKIGKYGLHSGVEDIQTFTAWLAMRLRSAKSLKVICLSKKDNKNNDLLEWALSHVAVLEECMLKLYSVRYVQ